ncbi:MAG: hypothetical protein R3266_03800 [Gemmatimonadota bacterium]|nr:hypothetical protein [Gemmatimonadota bacterium]
MDHLCADPGRARERLDWEPRVSFEAMIREMVQVDIERLKSGRIPAY